LPEIGLFTDFGSTYTKIVAIDLDNEEIVGQGQSTSTVGRDIVSGFQSALSKLTLNCQENINRNVKIKLACSSAAGGLRLVVVGLVPGLTVKAARLAALGAGAKVVGTYSYKLNHGDLVEMEQLSPDIILLSGGTDGGNEEVIIHNAVMLSQSAIGAPIVIAGNKTCTDDIKDILETNGRYVIVVKNVLGELDKLNVEPSRSAIRQIFMERIIYAKGLERAMKLVDKVLMPTPMSVLRAAELIARGEGEEKGLGELMVVDVGGATTDVHSMAHGHPADQRVVEKGLPEPFSKRTVEGDLGIRSNALSVLETAGIERILTNSCKLSSTVDLESKIRYLSDHTETLPRDEEDFHIDTGVAQTALEIAVERHVGYLEQVFTPTGQVLIQQGKDLTGIKSIIGTGGIFAYGRNPLEVMQGALFKEADPFLLKPKDPNFYIDRRYILFAIGLLADIEPEMALRIGKKHLKYVESPTQHPS